MPASRAARWSSNYGELRRTSSGSPRLTHTIVVQGESCALASLFGFGKRARGDVVMCSGNMLDTKRLVHLVRESVTNKESRTTLISSIGEKYF